MSPRFDPIVHYRNIVGGPIMDNTKDFEVGIRLLGRKGARTSRSEFRMEWGGGGEEGGKWGWSVVCSFGFSAGKKTRKRAMI